MFILALMLGTKHGVKANRAIVDHSKLQVQASSSDIISGQFIVELVSDYNPVKAAADFFKEVQDGNDNNKAEVVHYYEHVMNGFAVTSLTEDRLLVLLENPQVKAIWNVSLYETKLFFHL
jgi:hypothetical protein